VDTHICTPESHWYAARTVARHEKQVARQLTSRSLEFLLPVYETVHRWKNGRKKLELPLFPGYIFVRIPLLQRVQVLEVPGIAYLVGSQSGPIPVAEQEVSTVQRLMHRDLRREPFPYLQIGRRVNIRSGPLAGMQGVLLRINNHFRVVISVDLIMSSVAVEVDGCEVESCQ
jgi:transcription antitermination factor NusG